MTAEEFKAIRTSLRISQRQMAAILKVTHPTIVNAEKKGPSRALVLYLKEVMELGLLKPSTEQVEPPKRKAPRKRR